MIEFGSILSGVVASLLTFFLIETTKKIKDSLFFRKFTGYYDVFRNGCIVKGERVEFKYKGAQLFKAQSIKDGVPQWKSDIAMSPSNPLHGEGVYSSLNWHEFGIHSIQITPDDKEITVHFRNLSHSNGPYGGVLWKKQQVTLTPNHAIQPTGRVGRLMVDVGQ